MFFVGARRGIEQRLVPAAGYRLVSLSVEGLAGRGPVARARGALRAGWAVLQCLRLARRERPALAIGVGGYASGPALLAARWAGTKTMVLEQNHEPGGTNRWLAPRADAVCLPSEAARRRLGPLGGRDRVTGNPVRPEFFAIGPAPAGERLSLLVFGGSRGARSINRATAAALPALAAAPVPPRIVHQTGEADLDEARRAAAAAGYPADLYEARAFLDDMPRRLAEADLAVCRAGAGTLSELAAAGRAALLVPYPHAANDHQRKNAEAVRDAGAAELLLDRELDGERLARAILELAAAPGRRAAMGAAARRLARPDALADIADVAEALLDGRPLPPERGEGGADVP